MVARGIWSILYISKENETFMRFCVFSFRVFFLLQFESSQDFFSICDTTTILRESSNMNNFWLRFAKLYSPFFYFLLQGNRKSSRVHNLPLSFDNDTKVFLIIFILAPNLFFCYTFFLTDVYFREFFEPHQETSPSRFPHLFFLRGCSWYTIRNPKRNSS